MTEEKVGSLDIEKKGIGELIKRKHTVPKNQREFAWETEHITDFINDITAAMQEGRAEYFLGTIVLIKEGKNFEVVDGQQRMATTCIVIAAARDYLIRTGDSDNIKAGEILSSQYLLRTDVSTLTPSPHFQLNEIDNDFFRNFIIEEPKQKSSAAFKKETPSHVRLKKAYELASGAVKKIAEAPPAKAREQLARFAMYLEENVKVIVIGAPSEASAFTLFETLNDRGVELAISDLLKNFLFGRGGDRIVEVRDRWMAMKNTLENADAGDTIVMYVRHLWCAQHGLVREKQLYESIKKSVINPAKAVTFADSLSKNAKSYAGLVNPDQESWKHFGFNTYKSLRALNILSHTQPRPLILAVLNKFTEKEVEKAIRAIEGWSFRFSITHQLGGESMEREYSRLAQKIFTGTIKNTAALLNALKFLPTDKEFKEAFLKFTTKKAILARYMLIELELIKAGPGKKDTLPNENPDDVNLEHVLPRSWPAAGWGKFTQETHHSYAHRLGNLAIMNSTDNTNNDQDPFQKKKKAYAKSAIELTKELANLGDWEEASIDTRQSQLADLAVKRW